MSNIMMGETMNNRDYYIAKGRSLDAINTRVDAVQRYYAAVIRVFGEFDVQVTDTNTFLCVGDRVLGVILPDPVPAMLRRDREDPECCRPNNKTKLGRELQRKLNALDAPSTAEFYKALSGHPHSRMMQVNGRVMMSGYGFETLGGVRILFCPEGSYVPFDAEPLARSAYWKMRETATDEEVAAGLVDHRAVAL